MNFTPFVHLNHRFAGISCFFPLRGELSDVSDFLFYLPLDVMNCDVTDKVQCVFVVNVSVILFDMN